jgi:hemoglobin
MKIRHAAIAALVLASFASVNARADDSLYKQFGEKEGLTKIVDDMYDNVLADPRTAPYFENAPVKRIKPMLVDQFCEALEGPCKYTGRSMKRAHEGHAIDRAAFDALVEDLQLAMDKNNVPFHAQNKLLAKLAPLYRDIQDRP